MTSSGSVFSAELLLESSYLVLKGFFEDNDFILTKKFFYQADVPFIVQSSVSFI